MVGRPALDWLVELPGPAFEFLGGDARNVHRLLLAEEIVERDADQARRRALEKGVDRPADRRSVGLARSLWQDAFRRQPAEQLALLATPLLPGALCVFVRGDEPHLALDVDVAAAEETFERRHVVRIRGRQRIAFVLR